jgi:hypothetical protein
MSLQNQKNKSNNRIKKTKVGIRSGIEENLVFCCDCFNKVNGKIQ